MPLFDFFKKSSKKEQSQKASSEDTLRSPEMQKKRYDAAMDFLKFFQDKTPLLNGRPHAGTVMSVAARLAGTSLFRAINREDFKPNVVVLSEEVNTAYPKLLDLFAYYCQQNGIDVMEKPVVTEFPEQDKPLMDLAQIQSEYQDQYNEIMRKHGLDHLEGARAGMVICSMFFNYHCVQNKDIDPYVATGIVAMGVVEGAKTGPVPLKTENRAKASEQDKKKAEVKELLKTIAESSISGSGEKLVLGGKFTAMKEAMDNGGKYILVHPEVESKLKKSHIDLFSVYLVALLNEIQARIAQIDFVGGNVDQLAQQWDGKPEKDIPVDVQQMLWLEENAERFGYQRSGNSWKLRA